MLHVLVVEDEGNIRWMVNVLLKQQGYDITESHDGDEALTILNLNPAFDLIITNLQMPGMNGLHLMKQLKEFYPQIPILVMSAYLELPSARVVNTTHIAYLAKPFSRQQLLNAVSNFAL